MAPSTTIRVTRYKIVNTINGALSIQQHKESSTFEQGSSMSVYYTRASGRTCIATSSATPCTDFSNSDIVVRACNSYLLCACHLSAGFGCLLLHRTNNTSAIIIIALRVSREWHRHNGPSFVCSPTGLVYSIINRSLVAAEVHRNLKVNRKP
jgi:hypothetical protein